MMTLFDEKQFQLFCYNRYLEPYRAPLTESQKITCSALKKYGGDISQAATYMRMSREKIRSHITSIEQKGWTVAVKSVDRRLRNSPI